jgi:hypothetical protein
VFDYQPKGYDGYDEINLLKVDMQHFASIFLYNEDLYISKNSTAADPDPARCPSAVDLHAVSQDRTRLLCRAALQMQFSVVDKSRKKLIQI